MVIVAQVVGMNTELKLILLSHFTFLSEEAPLRITYDIAEGGRR